MPHPRMVFLLPGLVALVAGILGGLLRMGWHVPVPVSGAAMLHGPLMVSAFFGTLIGLERAVASRRAWAYGAPLLSGAGGLLLVLGFAHTLGALLFTLAGVVTLAVFTRILKLDSAIHHVVMALGAAAWLTGNLMWYIGASPAAVTWWWMVFFVLTIAGERLELNRLLPPGRHTRRLFMLAVAVVLAGTSLAWWFPDVGIRILGLGLLGMTAWLMRYDVARRTIRGTGLTRFIAVCLLSGYVWLAASGVLLISSGSLQAGPLYDAALHTFFVGFVFAMIFGHAPIIFPAVFRMPVPYHRYFYAHLGLLHAGLLLRIVGDLGNQLALRQWGGMLNAAAIAVFFAMTIGSGVRGLLAKRPGGAKLG